MAAPAPLPLQIPTENPWASFEVPGTNGLKVVVSRGKCYEYPHVKHCVTQFMVDLRPGQGTKRVKKMLFEAKLKPEGTTLTTLPHAIDFRPLTREIIPRKRDRARGVEVGFNLSPFTWFGLVAKYTNTMNETLTDAGSITASGQYTDEISWTIEENQRFKDGIPIGDQPFAFEVDYSPKMPLLITFTIQLTFSRRERLENPVVARQLFMNLCGTKKKEGEQPEVTEALCDLYSSRTEV